MGSLPQGTCWKRRISGPARSRPRRALCIFLWRRASGPESTGGRVTTIQNGKVYGASLPVIEAGAPIALDHTEGGPCVPDTYAHRPAERYGHPPGREMRKAIARAEVGDDVFGEDPTMNRLLEQVSARLGKEAAIFVPSGTMGNQICVNVHTRPGDEALAHVQGHVLEHGPT